MALRIPALLLCLAITFSLVECGGGQGNSPLPGQKVASLSETVDAVVRAAMLQQGMPGMTVALARKGTMLYAQAYGVSDLATSRATRTNDIFEIGSITKQFTAALIMRLQEQRLLHVDDSLATYLPEYNFSSITLRMMLSHTSGLADFTNFAQFPDWVRNGVSETTILTAVSQAPLEFPPGKQYSYSNSNFYLLGTIIEKLTGQPYATDLDQYFFQPLGMRSTSYSLPTGSGSALGYTSNGTGLVPAVIWNRSAAFATGALSSNVYDLAAWDYALINGKAVSPVSFKEMTTPNGFAIPGGGSYGFGLALDTFNGRPIIWHNGQIGGFTAETAVFLDSGFAVVVLTNDQDASPDAVVLKIMGAVCTAPQLAGGC